MTILIKHLQLYEKREEWSEQIILWNNEKKKNTVGKIQFWANTDI